MNSTDLQQDGGGPLGVTWVELDRGWSYLHNGFVFTEGDLLIMVMRRELRRQESQESQE